MVDRKECPSPVSVSGSHDWMLTGTKLSKDKRNFFDYFSCINAKCDAETTGYRPRGESVTAVIYPNDIYFREAGPGKNDDKN